MTDVPSDAGDIRELVARAAAATRAVVAGVRAEQLDDPTPCPELSVRELLAHLVEAVEALGTIGARRLAPPGPPIVSDPAGVLEAYDAAVAATRAAWQEDGAMAREYDAPWGPSSADQLLGFLLLEILVHGWDIAVATDQAPPDDPVVVSFAYERATQTIDDRARIPGVYGPEVPVPSTAPIVDRLAGFLGRRPGAAEVR